MKIHRSPYLTKWLIEAMATAMIYYGAARLGLLLAFQNTNASPVWPPSGIAFAAVLLLGYRIWPGIMVGAFLANVVVFLANGSDTGSIVAVSFFIGIGNTLEAVSGAFFLHRFVGSRNPLDRSQDVSIFVIVALLMCLVSSFIGATSLCLAGMVPWALYRTIWFTWWLGDTAGVLVLTPFLLAWCKKPLVRWRSSSLVEAVLFLVLLLAICLIAFGRWFPLVIVNYMLAFMLVPFIVWAAFRFGQSAVVLSILLVSGVAIWGTTQGSGPFVREILNESLWLLQSFVGIVTVTGLLLAAVLTERKRAEEMLRNNEERYRALYEDNPSMYFTVDTEGKVLSVNRFGAEQLGYAVEELVGQSVLNVVYDDDKKAVLEQLSWCLQNPRQVTDWEFRKLRKDGSVLWVREVTRALWDTSGKMVVLIVCEDITQRRLAEEKFRLVVESASNGIVMVNQRGEIILVNSQIEKLFGYNRQELIGQPVEILVPRRLRRKHSEYRTGFHTDPQARPMGAGRDLFAMRKDGSEFPVEIGLNPIQTKEGAAVLGTIVDITERKRMEEELLRAQKLESLGVLAGGLAHDFNNLLTAILGNISLVKIYGHPDEKTNRRLTEAEKASVRARDLTLQLLTFSKGGAPIKRVTTIGELIRESASFAQKGSNVRCEFSISENLWHVEVDDGQLSQVINNLVINAQQAMPQGGVMRISAENVVSNDESASIKHRGGDFALVRDKKYVRIIIEDYGIGIPEEHIPKIFDPYFTTKQKGSGLGLAVTYSIIKNHDGQIAVESKLEIGTKFYIYLPAHERDLPVSGYEEKEGPVPGKGRILVMDDEDTITDFLADMLGQIGYEVGCARDGVEAIELYREAKESSKPFDVVIMDLTIPGGMGGREAIKRLKSINPEVKAIVSSGYLSDAVVSEYRKYGFSGVLAKPYKIQELSEVLNRIMRGTVQEAE